MHDLLHTANCQRTFSDLLKPPQTRINRGEDRGLEIGSKRSLAPAVTAGKSGRVGSGALPERIGIAGNGGGLGADASAYRGAMASDRPRLGHGLSRAASVIFGR
jgi:hypothetical protein